MTNIVEEKLDRLIKQSTAKLEENIEKFNEIGQKFVQGEITSAEFKGNSGGMGVYAQRGGKEFMIRLRILSGVLDLPTLKLVEDFVKDYQLNFVHFTTRQTIQLHHLKFDEVIDIMRRSLKHQIITRGGGGNFPRNVSLSPMSGVALDEAFDVTPYAILVNKYFLSRINSYYLPRKFKVAFSNNSEDTAKATIVDLGFLAVKKDGKDYFKVFVGGSLGADGDIAVPFDELVKAEEMLYHVEAALSLFTEEGDFENKAKARMRFIVKRMGKEAFLECYKKHLNKVKASDGLYYYPTDKALDENGTREKISDIEKTLMQERSELIPQKQEGLYTIIVHPQGGLLKTKDYNNIVRFFEKYPNAEARISMEESLYIRNLNKDQAEELLELTEEYRKTTRLEQSISCIGVPVCQIGIQESQMLLMNILSYFEEKGLKEDILPALHISGCTNSCGRHQVNILGFRGKKKKVGEVSRDAYTFFAGGKVSEGKTNLATEYGDILADAIPEFLYKLALILKEKELEFEEYLEEDQEDFIGLVKQYNV